MLTWIVAPAVMTVGVCLAGAPAVCLCKSCLRVCLCREVSIQNALNRSVDHCRYWAWSHERGRNIKTDAGKRQRKDSKINNMFFPKMHRD